MLISINQQPKFMKMQNITRNAVIVVMMILSVSAYANCKLTVKTMYAELVRQGIAHPKIVLAQSILETGWYKSRQCKVNHNCFGLYNAKQRRYAKFKSWQHSVTVYKTDVQYKYNKHKHKTYYDFLHKIGYAADRNYITKLKRIVALIEQSL